MEEENRQKFWESLPVSDVADLIDEHQDWKLSYWCIF